MAGVPGDPLVYYAGSASGGIFKTTDGGITGNRSSTTSRCTRSATSPSRRPIPSIVWAGTGEACIRSHISVGEGIFKSTDAGRTWTRMGLEKTGRIGRVVVHPQNPDVVLACALGHAYGPQPERGVFRTTDGGKTWDRVLFVDENTGCSELAMDPTNPRKLFAGMWQIEIKTWGRESGGPGSGLFTSNDGGTTWTRLAGAACPTRDVGKVKVAIAPSNPNRVYALIETGDGIPWKGKETDRGQVWRSDDGGENWRVVSYDRNAMGRAHYYSHIFVAPDNENETYYLTAGYSVSLDGGETLVQQTGRCDRPAATTTTCGSIPTNANRMIVGHDQGFSISHQSRAHLVSQSAAERADVSRHGRQPDSLQRLRQQAGRPVVPRAEQQPSVGRRRIPRSDVAHRRRRRERLGDARSRRSKSDLVERVRLRQRRRHRRDLRGEPAPGAQRRSVARAAERRPPADLQVPLQLDDAAHDLAARSQHGLRRQPARAPDDQRRPELGGDQPGPDAPTTRAASSSPAGSPATTSASSTRLS